MMFKPTIYYAKSEFVNPDQIFKVAGSPEYIIIHPTKEHWFIALAIHYGCEALCMNRPQPKKRRKKSGRHWLWNAQVFSTPKRRVTR